MRRYSFTHTLVEHRWNYVIGMKLIRTYYTCDRICSGQFHFFVDPRRTTVQCTAKDARKAEDVIDLVGIIGTPRADDNVLASGPRLFVCDLRIGIG